MRISRNIIKSKKKSLLVLCRELQEGMLVGFDDLHCLTSSDSWNLLKELAVSFSSQ